MMKPHLYEQIATHGASTLSDAELLQVLLRTGSKAVPMQNIVAQLLGSYPQFDGLRLAEAEDLTQISGIGLSKAAGLLAAIEFGQRVNQRSTARFGEVKSVESLAQALMPRLGPSAQEQVLAFLLDSQLALIQEMPVSVGGLTQAAAEPRVVFSQALKVHADSLVLAHNHPSGNVQPSPADKRVTAQFVEAGLVMGIPLLDHLIIGAHDFYSFASQDEGLNFFK